MTKHAWNEGNDMQIGGAAFEPDVSEVVLCGCRTYMSPILVTRCAAHYMYQAVGARSRL